MRNLLALILGCKRIHKQRRTLPGFLRIFMGLCGSKVQVTPLYRNFINDVTNPKIVYMLLLFKYLLTVMTDLKKKKMLTLKENSLIKYLMELTWVGRNHLKNGCFKQLVFGGLMRFYQFEFYLHQTFIVIFLAVDTATGSFRRKNQNLYLSNRTDLL